MDSNTDWRPNLFVAGFPRCGTTELCDYLSQHPDMFLPWEKEPHTFYDIEKFPAYFSGDRTGNDKHPIMKLDDYRKMFSDSTRFRYRVDATVSYCFNTKFANTLKAFSESAKVIMLIRDQNQRLASMYFFSFVRHKEDNFLKWINEYLLPVLDSYLYHNKIVAYYEIFGHDLRIIETKNLSSPELHRLLFEFLDIEPVKINVAHKNPSLFTPNDSKLYRELILILGSCKMGAFKAAQSIGLEGQFLRMSRSAGDFIRASRKSRRNDYSEMIKLIPISISSILDEDYAKTIDFASEKGILIRP